MRMKPSLIFFGNERLATGLPATPSVTLRRLLDEGYTVEAVATRTAGKDPNPVASLAASRNIPAITPATKEELIQQIEPYRAELGVLVSFGLIIPQAVLDRFPHGILNIHPSLLPIYRGPTPIEQAILDGASETGVSIMRLTAEMDAGPLVTQSGLSLAEGEPKADLARKQLEGGTDLLVGALKEPEAAGTPQDAAKASYCQPICKTDSVIEWNKPAERLEREVRAYLGWPGSRTQLFDREVIITATHVLVGESLTDGKMSPGSILRHGRDTLLVVCGEGILAIDRLKPAGKREMSAAEFLRGLPQAKNATS